jgi:hypothetical protein
MDRAGWRQGGLGLLGTDGRGRKHSCIDFNVYFRASEIDTLSSDLENESTQAYLDIKSSRASVAFASFLNSSRIPVETASARRHHHEQ